MENKRKTQNMRGGSNILQNMGGITIPEGGGFTGEVSTTLKVFMDQLSQSMQSRGPNLAWVESEVGGMEESAGGYLTGC